MDWAVAHGYRPDNPAGRAFCKVLPQMRRLKWHHLVFHYGQGPGAMSQLRDSAAHSLTKLAVEILVLTAARSGEVMKADWSETPEPGRFSLPG